MSLADRYRLAVARVNLLGLLEQDKRLPPLFAATSWRRSSAGSAIHQRAKGVGADMSLAELRLALGVTEAQLMEAVKVTRLSDDLKLAFTSRTWDRVTLGPSWRGRCEDVTRPWQ